MMSECTLRSNLIEGFLFEFLGFGKTEEQIYIAILERFGEELCASSDLNSKGIPRYKRKTRKILERGIHNGIYLFEESTKKYRIPE